MMGGWGGGAGIGVMFLFWAAIILGAVWLLAGTFPRPSRNRLASGYGKDEDRTESPLDILKRRYASGELDRAEYETMRRELDR